MDDSNKSPEKGAAHPECASFANPYTLAKSVEPEDVLRMKMEVEDGFVFPKYRQIWDYHDKPIKLSAGWDNIPEEEQPVLEYVAPEAIDPDLLTLAGLNDQEKFERSITTANRPGHPTFSKPIEIGTSEAMARFWAHSAEICPSFEKIEKQWVRAARRKKYDEKLLENRITFYCSSPGDLKNAGVIGKEEAAKMVKNPRPDLEILFGVMHCGEFPEEIELAFLGGCLRVNEVPTTIREDDVRDLYNGYLSFRGQKEATQVVVEFLKEKLLPLFKKEKELPLFKEAQNT